MEQTKYTLPGTPVVTVETNVPCTMRDGTVLRADVYRPAGDAPLPVLLLRKQAPSNPSAADLLAAIEGDLSDDAVLAEVVSRLREHEVTAQALAEAKRWAQAAVDAIASLPNGSIKNAFVSFAEAVVVREG